MNSASALFGWHSALVPNSMQIHMALQEEFGDDSLLFVSLCNTVEYWRDEDGRETEPKRVMLGGPTRTRDSIGAEVRLLF